MKKVLHIIIIAFCIMTVSSCSKDESEKRIEFAKIVESRTSQDLLNDLYVGSDADIEAIYTILQDVNRRFYEVDNAGNKIAAPLSKNELENTFMSIYRDEVKNHGAK